MELALEYQAKWVKDWSVNPNQQPHFGFQIPAEDFTTLPVQIHGRGQEKVGEVFPWSLNLLWKH